MLAEVDPFGASDSRNNLLSAYKQIYKRAYLSGDMRVVNFIDGFFFSQGALGVCRYVYPCHGHRKSLFRRTKAFNPPNNGSSLPMK